MRVSKDILLNIAALTTQNILWQVQKLQRGRHAIRNFSGQARFLRMGNTSINILSTTLWRKALQEKISEFYLLEAVKTVFQMRHLTHRCTQSASLNITFFKAWAECPAEKMLRRTRWISDRASDKNIFWKKSGHREFAWLLKQFGANVFW